MKKYLKNPFIMGVLYGIGVLITVELFAIAIEKGTALHTLLSLISAFLLMLFSHYLME